MDLLGEVSTNYETANSLLLQARNPSSDLLTTKRCFLEAATIYFNASENCGDKILKASLLYLSVSAAKEANGISKVISKYKENDLESNIPTKSSETINIITSTDNKISKFYKGRLAFGVVNSNYFDIEKIPTIKATNDSEIVKDMLLLEKKLEEIGNFQNVSSSSYTSRPENNHNYNHHHGRDYLSSTLGDSFLYMSQYHDSGAHFSGAYPTTDKSKTTKEVTSLDSFPSYATTNFSHSHSPSTHDLPNQQANRKSPSAVIPPKASFNSSDRKESTESSLYFSNNNPNQKDQNAIPDNIFNLLQTITRLGDENSLLIKKVENLSIYERKHNHIMSELKTFKDQYEIKFKKMKEVLTDFSNKYVSEKNPANLVQTMEIIKPLHPRGSHPDGPLLSKRVSQLEKMVSGLLDRIEKNKIDIIQKETKIKKFEDYFSQLKKKINEKRISENLLSTKININVPITNLISEKLPHSSQTKMDNLPKSPILNSSFQTNNRQTRINSATSTLQTSLNKHTQGKKY